MFAMGSSSDRGWVVAPFGYCSFDEERCCRRWWWQWREVDEEEEEVVVVEASTTGGGTGWRVLLVYELMHNGSLQDALLDRRCPELMDWGHRFSVALDIARRHAMCDPPVIHGDIKPSNILLDTCLSTKIADFGLARLKKPIADDLSAVAVVPATNLCNNEVVIEIELNKTLTGDSKSFSNDRKDSAVGGGERYYFT